MTERKTEMDVLGVNLLFGFSVLLGLNQALVKLVDRVTGLISALA